MEVFYRIIEPAIELHHRGLSLLEQPKPRFIQLTDTIRVIPVTAAIG